MRNFKIAATILALLFLCGCEPVNTPDSVMFSTKNEKVSEPRQAS